MNKTEYEYIFFLLQRCLWFFVLLAFNLNVDYKLLKAKPPALGRFDLASDPDNYTLTSLPYSAPYY